MKTKIKKMNVVSISETIKNYKTKNKIGFLNEEMAELLKSLPQITSNQFNKTLGKITCMIINGQPIVYRHDVEKAIICCFEKRGISVEEFD